MTIDESTLAQAIQQRHGCNADFVRAETLDATVHEQADWDGRVAVFSVDHPETDICYAWSMPFDASGLPWKAQDSTPEALFAVLRKPPIDGPSDAWRHVSDAVANLAGNELEIAPVNSS